MTPAARRALRAYPPSFRERYGEELTALSEDLAPSVSRTFDLYLGAAGAWLRPAFTGPDSIRRRLQASTSIVWSAWCAGFLLVPAVNKALLDPPGSQADATVRRLLDTSTVLLALGWVIALAGATVIGWRALLPALRSRRWFVLAPLLPALILGAIEVCGLVALAWAARSHDLRPTPTIIALVSAWLVGLLALVMCSGFGPAITIRRLQPSADILRVPTLLAAALSVCLAGATAMCAVAVLLAGDASLLGSFAPVAASVGVAVAASSTALVSATRGVLALRRWA